MSNTHMRNRKKRKLLKSSGVRAALPRDFSNEFQGSPEMPSDSNSRDITILIVLLWFSIVHYSACFSAFLCIYYRPYKFLFF